MAVGSDRSTSVLAPKGEHKSEVAGVHQQRSPTLMHAWLPATCQAGASPSQTKKTQTFKEASHILKYTWLF